MFPFDDGLNGFPTLSIYQTKRPDKNLNVDQNEKSQRLPPGQHLVAPEKWPYVGEREPASSDKPWSLSVMGQVENPISFSIEELQALPQTSITTDIHCVTRWSKFDARFSGVLLSTLLDKCKVAANAKFVSFVARSERQHSSSLRLQEAIDLGCLLAMNYNECPLPVDHGGPLRGVVPGKYFYKSVKWIERVELLEVDRPGFWEAESGYHNNADPWLQQRYIASSISKREAGQLIESLNFSGQSLLSIDVSSMNLSGLVAREAVLRNANFSCSTLVGADFKGTNLTNASFREAVLSGVNFRDADLEGVDFAAADLRGADLTGCSLFGTTFFDSDKVTDQQYAIDHAAKLDASTIFDQASLRKLTDVQREFVERATRGN